MLARLNSAVWAQKHTPNPCSPVLARARAITRSRARPGGNRAAKRARDKAYMPGGSHGLTGRSTCGKAGREGGRGWQAEAGRLWGNSSAELSHGTCTGSSCAPKRLHRPGLPPQLCTAETSHLPAIAPGHAFGGGAGAQATPRPHIGIPHRPPARHGEHACSMQVCETAFFGAPCMRPAPCSAQVLHHH